MRVLALLALLALTGCKTTSFEQILADGRRIRVRDTRMFTVTTAEIEGTINPTNGVMTIRIKAASKGDTDSIEAVAAGVAKGLKTSSGVP